MRRRTFILGTITISNPAAQPSTIRCNEEGCKIIPSELIADVFIRVQRIYFTTSREILYHPDVELDSLPAGSD